MYLGDGSGDELSRCDAEVGTRPVEVAVRCARSRARREGAGPGRQLGRGWSTEPGIRAAEQRPQPCRRRWARGLRDGRRRGEAAAVSHEDRKTSSEKRAELETSEELSGRRGRKTEISRKMGLTSTAVCERKKFFGAASQGEEGRRKLPGRCA